MPPRAAKDQIQNQKVSLYEKYGVKEYWHGHPSDRLITVRLLAADGKYGIPKIHEAKGLLPMNTLLGLEIDLDLVFRRL